MNTRIKYTVPVVIAVIALVFAFTPSVMAESKDYAMWEESTNHPMKSIGSHVIIEGFVGTIRIPEEMNKETHNLLKSQIKISLSNAVSIAEANGITDATNANIGIVSDGVDKKYLAWIVSSMNNDLEIMTMNTFVIDAGDATKFASTSTPLDHSKMGEKMYDDKTVDHSKMGEKMYDDKTVKNEKFFESKRDADTTRVKFLDLTQQLREAIKNGDITAAELIKKQLEEIRPSFLNIRNSWF